MMKNVTLVLSDGTKFHGKSFGYDQPVAGEALPTLPMPDS